MQTALEYTALDKLDFDNRFVAELPGDPLRENRRRQVTGACYSRVDPTPVSAPQLVAFSPEMAAELDLSEADCSSDAFTRVFSGNILLPGMEPFAMCYGGHQFGTWAGQLGDGRAINLGEIVNGRAHRWVLQLKGAGPTPYSRSADGLAVLRSSLREFVCSEAMYHLTIPTTRALSLILTGERVLRDMFYDGNPAYEPGAVVCRTSPSFIRFGNFEILAAREEIDLLEQLVSYTIRTDFPHLPADGGTESCLRWFTEVCERTAAMVVDWMRVGFVHGVMNSDNMSILGLTIDYGPYGWLEGYDPAWTPNTTDAQGRRYCYGNQPYMAQWNLVQLANALYPLINEKRPLEEALDRYRVTFQTRWQQTLRAKLGLNTKEDGDDRLITALLDLLGAEETDLTIFFRRLADITTGDTPGPEPLAVVADAFYQPDTMSEQHRRSLAAWLEDYRGRIGRNRLGDAQRRVKMNAVNPKYVFRNYLAQEAIDRVEQGDFSAVDELLEVLRRPYDDRPEYERYAAKRPEWARHKPGCSMLSCSS